MPADTFVLVGVGGLGCPLALALALASDARLVLVDDDLVDESNLQRQILFHTADVGRPKVTAAVDALVRRGVARDRLEPVRARFDEATARALVHDATVVCDGTDSPETKFLVNDVCVALGRRFVIAGAIAHRGQVFPVRPGIDACYRCLFEAPPTDVESCAGAGVIGATCGLTAAWQARSVLALAAGDGVPFRIIEENTVRSLAPRRRSDCFACGAPEGDIRWPRSASPPPSAS
jgi:molybdopterin-synthase adenylyltransferase